MDLTSDETKIRIADITAEGHKAQAVTQKQGNVDAATVTAQGHVDAASVQRKGLMDLQEAKNKQEVMDDRTTGLGDPGKSWGGQGPVNLAEIRKRSPGVPAGTGPETGEIQRLTGGVEALGDGTFNRPAHRDVVGAETGAPVHVIRKMKQTYAGGGPGEEFQDIGRARQAMNRAAGIGEYVSHEEAKIMAEVEKNPKLKMEAIAGYAALAKNSLRERFVGEFATIDPNDPNAKPALSGEMEKLFNKHASGLKHPDEVEDVWAKIQPLVETHKVVQQWKNPDTRKQLMVQSQDYYNKLPAERKPMTNEAFADYLKKAPADVDSMGWLMKHGGLSPTGSPKLTRPGAAPGTGVPLPPGFGGTTPAPAPAAAARGPLSMEEAASWKAPAAAPGVATAAAPPGEAAPSLSLPQLQALATKPRASWTPEEAAAAGPNLQASIAKATVGNFFTASPEEMARRQPFLRGDAVQPPAPAAATPPAAWPSLELPPVSGPAAVGVVPPPAAVSPVPAPAAPGVVPAPAAPEPVPGPSASTGPALQEIAQRVREITQKPLQERGPEDVAFLHSLGPDYNIQANLAMHKMGGFFRPNPVQDQQRLVTLRKMYRDTPGTA